MSGDNPNLVRMSWDPITRIVGSLGLHTTIDFANRRVIECHSTSSIFRGYSIFMKGKDPRDAHFITSRICGICGDNHATCAVYAQNMAFGVRPPALAEWIINLGEAAEYMFDHNLYQDNLVGVDFCEQMVRETNPSVLARAETTSAPHAAIHGYRTIADIMRALNPFTGTFYREALQMSRLSREMFCLMEGRHVHPSTLYPGGVGTVPSIQLFTEYQVRLMKYAEFLKRAVPLHDDLFDFFYDALPGYEEVGRRRVLLGCWGAFNDPDACDFTYARMPEWGRAMYVTPGIVVDGELITTDLVEINLGIRILLGSSFYDDWQDGETFVRTDPLGNPVDQRHPWNQTTTPRPQKRDLQGRYTWVMSPRWFDQRTNAHRALDTGGGPLARFWVTALAGLVDIGYIKATGSGVKIYLPKTMTMPEVEFEWKIPRWNNTLERDCARTYFQAYAAAAALYFIERALEEVHAGRTETWSEFQVPEEAIGCGFHEAVRGLLSHHVVIRQGKIANYHPYPPTCWNASPRDSFGTPGPYEDAVQGTPIFEENGPDGFKGIDIMRTAAQFRPVPALRRPHVPGQWQGDLGPTFPHFRGATGPGEGDMNKREESEFPRGIGRIEELIQAVEGSADPAARDHARELARAILDLHGMGLCKMVEFIAQAGGPGRAILDACTRDDLVRSLLLLHNLHPQGQEARVQQVLAQLQPLLLQHGADLKLVGVADGLVRLQTWGGNRGTPLPPALSRLVEGAILEAMPDVERIEFEDASGRLPRPPLGTIALPLLGEGVGHCRECAHTVGETPGCEGRHTRPPAGGT